MHGGNTRNGQKSAAKQAMAAMGALREMEPVAALLEQVWSVAHDVFIVRTAIATATDPARVEIPVGETVVALPLSDVVAMHEELRREAAHIAKIAVDAGIAERVVRLAEAEADMFVTLLNAVADRLELTGQQRKLLPVAVDEGLRLIEGGKAA